MKAIKSILCGVVISSAMAVSSALATPMLLMPGPNANADLGAGSYMFAGSASTGEFSQQWDFSLADASNIQISINNTILFPELQPASCDPLSVCINFADLQLTSAGGFDAPILVQDGDTLSVTGLVPGVWYSLLVSGFADGVFGGQYEGMLEISVRAVPSAFGVFGASALFGLFFAMRRRQARH